MRFEDARIFLFNKLENELPPDLLYHNIHHTREVLAAAEELAALEGIYGDELLLLKTASVFHDNGYLMVYEGHENASCELATSILPDFDYSDEEIKNICGLIRATQIPQIPLNKNARIL